jgi:ribonuclease III
VINKSEIEMNIGYYFKDKALLALALTHKSSGKLHNERLEFLGDAILSSIITAEIFSKFSDKNEGVLSRMRSHLIQKEKLIDVAQKLKIESSIILSSSEKKRNSNAGGAILADALEALIGAIFLDSNWNTCAKIIMKWYDDELKDADIMSEDKDPKTKLQEFMQALVRPIPAYEVVKTEGEEHDQVFTVSCKVKGLEFKTNGTGKTRKKAEQNAAKSFLEKLQTKEKI